MKKNRSKKPADLGLSVSMRRLFRDHFIPHEGNGHVPHVLRHRVLFGYAVLLVLLKALVITVSVALPSSFVFSSAISPENIISLTNATRRALGITELKANARLAQAATAKAADMLTEQYFAHTSPSGETPWSWIHGAGYEYRYAGENLAVHYSSSEDTVNGWMASPSHRANIAATKYSEIGVGMAQGTFEGVTSTFVVQMFGHPKAEEPATAPVTEPTTAPSPTPAPQPAPTPSIVVAPVQKIAPAPGPVITPEATAVTPTPTGYDVAVSVQGATAVAALVGTEAIPLTTKTAPNLYTGSVPAPAEAASPGGDPVRIVASDSAGNQTVETVAWVAPDARTQDVFGYGAKKNELKILGLFRIDKLDDQVRKFYIYTVLFFATALLINLLVKVRVQHPKVVGHTLFLVGLALVLFII